MKCSIAKLAAIALGAAGLAATAVPAAAAVIIYDVNLTFDPNATPTSSLGAAGPGTVKGTITLDTSIPINTPTGNLVAVNLTEKSNNGTLLSVFTSSAVQQYNAVSPYVITFLWSPVTEYPAQSHLTGAYEIVSFSSPPIFDSIQVGPSIQFDFPYTAGGSVIPGNFDSIASTGFNAYLYGTVAPQTASAAPEPATWALMIAGFGGLGVALRYTRRKPSAAGAAA